MVLISSNKYQEAKALLKVAMRSLGNVEGATRGDDEMLTQADSILAEIDALLVPATDER